MVEWAHLVDFTPDLSGATGTFYKTVRCSRDTALEMRLFVAPGGTDPIMSAVVFAKYNNVIDIKAVANRSWIDKICSRVPVAWTLKGIFQKPV